MCSFALRLIAILSEQNMYLNMQCLKYGVVPTRLKDAALLPPVSGFFQHQLPAKAVMNRML